MNTPYQKIIKKLVNCHIIRVDFGSEEETDNFYEGLYSDEAHTKKWEIQ